ncbi:AraC family transcriptional regulator [Sandaracinus amylolyticus]|uniref:AraC family transcriptional regulator n=1 Tax=Sandaracinus amylolyticus TaxID=927083 RepID=UPI001F327B91|nr:AraC family transcriptional regulator [Sandaracinus amylolyticus]UJR83725.1 Hypothetical protein I5071_57960 [Sandaracinus amylolyticus]
MLRRVDGVPQQFEDVRDRAAFRRPAHRDGIELYRAHIVRHAFEPHVHLALGLGAIDEGVQRIRYRGSEHVAPAGSLVMMNADEVHTGRAETREGWRYRMIYVEPEVAAEITGERGWWFDDALARDAARARHVSGILAALWGAHDALAFDGLLLSLFDTLRPHARVARVARPEAEARFERVIDAMRARLDARHTLAELAAIAGLSPFHFQRRFKAAHHATPHEMLMALRLADAKRRLARGERPAAIAAAVGLADQAHLTRAFVRRYGATPARYQQQAGSRPHR